MNCSIVIHCNIVSNNYQQDSRVLYSIVLNKSFGQLLGILAKNVMFLKTLDSKFLYIFNYGLLIKILNH